MSAAEEKLYADRYYAAIHADDEWSAELRRVFGKNASEARYASKGAGAPGSKLRELYDAKIAADEARAKGVQ